MSATARVEAAFMGLLQGLAEFLPIPSSAHPRIVGPLQAGMPTALAALVAFGRGCAVIVASVLGAP